MLRDVANHLEESQHREITHVLVQPHALGLHQIAADAGQRQRRIPLTQLARDTRRVQVAGRLAGDEQDLTHVRQVASVSACS